MEESLYSSHLYLSPMKIKATIAGPRVQGVGYRPFLAAKAIECELDGLEISNVGDDRVVVLAEGAKGSIKLFMDGIMGERPSDAKVGKIREEEYSGPVSPIEKTTSGLTFHQLNTVIKVGREMLGKQYIAIEKQDLMLGKQDIAIEKQDQMLGKQDQMIGKQDQMIGKQDQMIGKQDVMIEKQDQTIEKLDEGLKILREGLTLMGKVHDEVIDLRHKYEELRKEVDLIKEKVYAPA